MVQPSTSPLTATPIIPTTTEPTASAIQETVKDADGTASENEETTRMNEDVLGTSQASEVTPILELRDVGYTYSKGGKHVLRNVTHTFNSGKVYAITGPSGAGKTTLLSLISGLASPSEGQVIYEGKDLAKQDRYKYRSHDIGVIFQSFNLLPSLTVSENIILSMDASGKHFDSSKKEVALDLLDRVHLPDEYANERILHLSGGEQQRVAIARAFSYDPKIIVADEPTGNLDLATQDDIMGIFRSLAHEQQCCVIIVTHSPEIAKASDEIFELAPLRRATRHQRQVPRK
jgi:putative ABC transport system ATP-binding protein